MVKYRSLDDRKKDAPKKVSLPGIKYRPIEEVTKSYVPKKPTIRSFEEEMVESFGLDMEWEKKQEAREKALKLPKLNLDKIRDSSENYDPYAEYLSPEEISAKNKQSHVDAGLQTEPEKEKKGIRLPFLNSTSQDGKPKATMSGNRNTPNENQKASLQVGGDTIYNQNRSANTDTGNSLMTDGNVKGMAKTEGVNGKFVDTKMDSNFLKDVGTGLKNVPRNALSGFSQAVGDAANVLEKVTGVKAPQSATDRESIEKEYGKMSDEVYEETKTYLEKLNGQKLSETIRQTTTSIASEVNEDTSKVERMIQGAAQSIPGSYISAMFGGLLGSVAKSYGAGPKLVKAIALSPLFTKATAGGLDEADEIGLKGTAKVGYALTMGGIETMSEGLFDNGIEASLMGLGDLTGLGIKRGLADMFKQGVQEGSEELVSSIASNLVRAGVTGEGDFEAMLDDAIVSFGAGAISGLVGSVGKLRNGTEYKIVGETSQGVVIETSDGKIETVQAETVFRHKFDTVKRAYLAEIVARPVTEVNEVQAEVVADTTTPLEAPTTSIEQSNIETEVSTPKEVKPVTEPLNEVETVSTKNVGYHYGDLGKAEFLESSEPSRGTGHFGTGTYFVGNADTVQSTGMKSRPMNEVDFSNYNLYKIKSRAEGYKLHDTLKDLNSVTTWGMPDDVIDFIANGEGYEGTEYGRAPQYLESFIENATVFNMTKEQAVAKIKELTKYVTENQPNAKKNKKQFDSPSTLLMKELGYEGIDVRGIKGLDDEQYGSVIYDLKNEVETVSEENVRTDVETVSEEVTTIPTKEVVEEKLTAPKVNDNKSITPKNMEARQTAEAKLDAMIKNKLIDTKQKRETAEKLNRQIVELGGKDRSNDFKKVEAPKVKKAETIVVKSNEMQTNNMTSSDEASDVLYPGEGDRVFKTRQSKKTLMESDKISQTMKDRVIEDDPALYEERKQRGVIIETKMDIQKIGYDNVYKEILAKVDEGDALSNDYDRAMLASMMEENQKLRVKHNDNGFYQDQFDKIYKIYAETGTENARGLAMQGQLVNTPIGKAMQSKREVEKHRTEEQGKLVEDIDKVVEELFIEDNLVDVEKVGKKLDKSFKLPKAWIEQLKKDIADESLSKTQVKERLAQQLKVPTLTQVEFDEVTRIAEELDKLDPKSENYKKDQKELTDKIRRMIDQKNITFWQKVSSVQTMAMLMNVKTTVRNEVGNFLGFGTGQIDDVFSYLFDMPISALTKQQGVLVPELDFRKYKWGANAKKSLALYNDQTMSDNKYQKKKVFTPGSRMGKLEGILSVMLSDARHKQSRIDMMEGQIPKTERRAEKKGLKFDPESHRAEFNYYADYNTFNFDSGLAKWLDGIVKKTNEYTPFIHDKDFGLGTILAKFAKTPMNIVQYQLDHLGGDLLREGVRTSRLANKVGLANAITQNQTRISRSLGKTATGLSYIAFGALLSNLGGFIDEEEDEDVKALLEANGVKGSYFNFTALRRSVFGGDPAYQEGDNTIDIKWMLPVAPFLILGSRLAKAKDEGEADTIMDSLQTTVETMGASMSDFAELPFNRTLGILTSPYYTGMDKFNKILSGTVTGFIPSPVKQLAQGLDPTSKTYSKNTAVAFGQQIKANLPMLRNTVPARFDITGEPIKFTDNTTVGWDIAEMFLNPAYSDTIKEDKVLNDILEANEKGKIPSLPKVARDSFSYGGTEYKMTPDQHQQYQKDYFEAYKKYFTKKNQDGNIMNAHDRASEEAKIKFMKANKIRYQTTDSGRLKLPSIKK